jgi:hypothetical protein
MSPRRLLPYLVVFLVVLGTFIGLRWHQAKKESREEQAKKIFNFQADEISALTLKRDREEVQLTRQGGIWGITKPLKTKAEPPIVESMIKALAELKADRDLGAGELKAFGLDKPELVVSFTAKGEQHHLDLGQAAPANRGYYVRKDGAGSVLLISPGARESLNQSLANLRDKTLLTFNPDQVKSVTFKVDKTQVDLEKTGPGAWRRVGQSDFRVHPDRVEQFLRQLQAARINDFPAAPPSDLKTVGLAPRAKIEVTLTTPQGVETLRLGTGTGTEIYARVGDQGPVVRVGKSLADEITKAAETLEDRRLWTGSTNDVVKLVWGPPGKTWTAVREAQAWKLTGPDKTEFQQSATRFETALARFRNLEYAGLLPPAQAAGQPESLVELLGSGDKPLFRLEVIGKQDQTGLKGRTQAGETAGAVILPQASFNQWQAEMGRLATPPPKPPQ